LKANPSIQDFALETWRTTADANSPVRTSHPSSGVFPHGADVRGWRSEQGRQAREADYTSIPTGFSM
jgi:hypothetical protein